MGNELKDDLLSWRMSWVSWMSLRMGCVSWIS